MQEQMPAPIIVEQPIPGTLPIIEPQPDLEKAGQQTTVWVEAANVKADLEDDAKRKESDNRQQTQAGLGSGDDSGGDKLPPGDSEIDESRVEQMGYLNPDVNVAGAVEHKNVPTEEIPLDVLRERINDIATPTKDRIVG